MENIIREIPLEKYLPHAKRTCFRTYSRSGPSQNIREVLFSHETTNDQIHD